VPPHRPTVSVIIPTYNCSGPLRLTLETVLWQDLEDFEVWVIGDGCTDESAEVVASFEDPRLHWVNLPENSGGPSRPRNEALRRARGQYVAYLGHDDLWFPWHLSSLTACIEQHGASFAYSLGALIGPSGCLAAFSLPLRKGRVKGGLSPSNWMHRRDLFETVGPWARHVKAGDDREFLERLWASGVPMSFCQKFSVLKFPAVLWRMYALREDYPQTAYVEAMRRDPQHLQDQLLVELGVCLSHQAIPWDKDRGPAYRALRRLLVRATYLYGRTRWPVNLILYRRWRRRVGLD